METTAQHGTKRWQLAIEFVVGFAIGVYVGSVWVLLVIIANIAAFYTSKVQGREVPKLKAFVEMLNSYEVMETKAENKGFALVCLIWGVFYLISPVLLAIFVI